MSFTVADFSDLLRLLEERPEWRAALRRQVLADDLLSLPALVRGLAEAQTRTELRVAELAHWMDALAQAQTRTEAQLGTLVGRVGTIAGELLELRYARRAPACLSPLARRLRALDTSTLANLLDDAVRDGQLTDEERDSVLAADLVLSGQRREDGAAAYFVVEVSAGVGLDDVRRAVERAGILARLGQPAVPVVAGRWINPDADAAARASGVRQALAGHATPLVS